MCQARISVKPVQLVASASTEQLTSVQQGITANLAVLQRNHVQQELFQIVQVCKTLLLAKIVRLVNIVLEVMWLFQEHAIQVIIARKKGQTPHKSFVPKVTGVRMVY